jgi:predicted RNA binding protein YcfA (HicA-like mRNA interferase family)
MFSTRRCRIYKGTSTKVLHILKNYNSEEVQGWLKRGSWFRLFLFEDDMETLRRIVPFHAREKIRGKMVMRIETKDTQERLGRKF